MGQAAAPRFAGLPAHLERHLGPITSGQINDDTGQRLPFGMVRFDSLDRTPSVTFATLGLARHELAVGGSGRKIRHELQVAARQDVQGWKWLDNLGRHVLHSHRAYLLGEVTASLGLPTDPLAAGSSLTGFYFTAPTYWPAELGLYDDQDGTVAVVFAIPVTAREQD